MKLNVFLNSSSETIRFAADEFCRILNQMDSSVKVAFIEEEGSADLKIGLFATDLLPKVDDVALDDAIADQLTAIDETERVAHDHIRRSIVTVKIERRAVSEKMKHG